MKGLKEFFEILYTLKPDVIVGYNTENFDWYFIDERLKLRGSSLLDFTKNYFMVVVSTRRKTTSIETWWRNGILLPYHYVGS